MKYFYQNISENNDKFYWNYDKIMEEFFIFYHKSTG